MNLIISGSLQKKQEKRDCDIKNKLYWVSGVSENQLANIQATEPAIKKSLRNTSRDNEKEPPSNLARSQQTFVLFWPFIALNKHRGFSFRLQNTLLH